MSHPASPPPVAPASRAEKLSILSALLGPDALARLREGKGELAAKPGSTPVPVDADRAAWHQNKLLERLRGQARSAPGPVPTPPVPPAKPAGERDGAPAARPAGRSLDARLIALAELATLADEHPAIIARLMTNLTRAERVTALKFLPGPVARVVLARLR